MCARAVVFDIGNVLVRWQPHLAWLEDLGDRAAVDAFLERVDFFARNLRADRGECFADLAAELADPQDRALLASYPARYNRTISDLIEGSWAILDQLQMHGIPTHAITNWSAETWGGAVELHPRLGSAFEMTVISGFERVVKPEAEIYQRLCSRAGVAPEECVFIDDSPTNIEGACAVGMDGIVFADPLALERALKERGLL